MSNDVENKVNKLDDNSLGKVSGGSLSDIIKKLQQQKDDDNTEWSEEYKKQVREKIKEIDSMGARCCAFGACSICGKGLYSATPWVCNSCRSKARG